MRRELQLEMVCERPPRSLRSRLPLTRGRLRLLRETFISPRPRGGEPPKAAGGRSHTLNWSWATDPCRSSAAETALQKAQQRGIKCIWVFQIAEMARVWNRDEPRA
jgi:hypothetical protein